MTLLNDYYRIENRVADGGDTLFDIALLPNYCAYAGHFPGNPVAPGVCNIQMIKECAELLAGRSLFIVHIARCRFSAIITPLATPRLQLRINVMPVTDETYTISATLFDDTTTYIQFKGELITVL